MKGDILNLMNPFHSLLLSRELTCIQKKTQLSLADIRTAIAIEHLAVQPCADELLEIINQSPSLIKVREMVAKDPKIAAWRASEEYLTLTSNSKGFFMDPRKFLPPPKN